MSEQSELHSEHTDAVAEINDTKKLSIKQRLFPNHVIFKMIMIIAVALFAIIVGSLGWVFEQLNGLLPGA